MGKRKNYYGQGVKYTPPCHIGFSQVHENVFVGKASDIAGVIDKVDMLIPLDKVDGELWEWGWNGEIFYVPIKDFSVLPKSVEQIKVQYVLDRINEGKKVAIFCLGGHGRTGYFASLVLGKLGVEDPIGELRKLYCEEAVETNKQIKAIADYLDKPQLIDQYPCTLATLDDSWFTTYLAGMGYDDGYSTGATNVTYKSSNWCGQCKRFHDINSKHFGQCDKCKKTVNKWADPCEDGFEMK